MAFNLGTALFHMQLAGLGQAQGGLNAFLGKLLEIKTVAGLAGSAVELIVKPWIVGLNTAMSLADQLVASLRIPSLTGFIAMAGEIQQVQVGMELMIGTAKEADALFDRMKRFSAETPLTFPQVRSLTQQLLTANIALDQIIPTARMLGDIAFPLAGAEGVNRLTHIYAQFKQQGQIFNTDLRQLTNLTIPIYKTLADMLGVTTARVMQLASEGRIGFGHIHQAFVRMTSEGGRFFDQMRQSSQTLPGLWTTFLDVLNTEVFANIGQRIVTAFNLQGLLQQAIPIANSLAESFGETLDRITADFNVLFGGTRVGFAEIGGVLQNIGNQSLQTFLDLLRDITTDLGAFAVLAGPSLTSILQNLADMLPGLASAITLVFRAFLVGSLMVVSVVDTLLVLLDAAVGRLQFIVQVLTGDLPGAMQVVQDQMDSFNNLGNRWKQLWDDWLNPQTKLMQAPFSSPAPRVPGAAPLMPEQTPMLPHRQPGFVGLAQLAEKMQLEALRNNQQAAMAASAAATASATEKLASAVDNGALRTRPDMTGIPAQRLGPLWG